MNDPSSNPSAELPRGIPDISGTVLDGRYQIDEVLGAGGMGAVFAARHLRLDRRVAVKVLKPTLMHREDYVQRFLREAKSASKIRHPNVVEIIDYGDVSDRAIVYTVMELLEGEDLSARLKRVGRLPWPQSRWILVQIVRALFAAHSQGIIHRDIKPANCFLLVGPPGRELVKVLDFGIAKLDEPEAGAPVLTGTSEILGTPSYMAPEMARGISANARSEIYSVGVLAYRMLGGKVPFDGNNAFDVLLQHATQAPPPLQTLAPDLPHKVVELVHQLLQKDPEARPTDMAEVERLLLSLDDVGNPCEPNPQSVYPTHPSSSSSSGPLPRSVTAGGIHPTPSGSLQAPQSYTPPPAGRDPAAKGLTMPPPGGPPRSSPSAPGRPPAPPPRPASGPSPAASPPGPPRSSPSQPGGVGTARTEFASGPPLKRPDGPPPSPVGTPRPPPPRPPAPDSVDRTMIQPSPSSGPPASNPVAPWARNAPVDRTMMAPSSASAPPSSPSAAPAASPPVDKTVVHEPGTFTPLKRPPELGPGMPSRPSPPAEDLAERTMIHPSSMAMGGGAGGGDLADRTMIHPPSAAMTSPGDGGGARRTSADDIPATDRTMILDASAGDPLELDPSDVVRETDAGTQIVEMDEATRQQFLAAAAKIQSTPSPSPAAPPGQAPGAAGQPAWPQPGAPTGYPHAAGPTGPHGQAVPMGMNPMGQSGPVDAYDPYTTGIDEPPSRVGRSVMLALIGGLLAIVAGGLVAWWLFAGNDDAVTASADEGADGGDEAGAPAADDGEQTPAAVDDGETPAADDGAGTGAASAEASGGAAEDGGAQDDAAAADDGAADDGAADDGADDGAAADDGADDDGGQAAGDDGGRQPKETKPEPKVTKPKGPPPDPQVKKRVVKAAKKACSPSKAYTISFLIDLNGNLKIPSVTPRDSTGSCILEVVKKRGRFRSRSTTSRERITISP